MNVQLKDITVTARDGRVSHLDQVYIRGSHVRFFIVPDMLRYDLMMARDQRSKMEGRGADMCALLGMRQCSDRGESEDGVWDWREEGQR